MTEMTDWISARITPAMVREAANVLYRSGVLENDPWIVNPADDAVDLLVRKMLEAALSMSPDAIEGRKELNPISRSP